MFCPPPNTLEVIWFVHLKKKKKVGKGRKNSKKIGLFIRELKGCRDVSVHLLEQTAKYMYVRVKVLVE